MTSPQDLGWLIKLWDGFWALPPHEQVAYLVGTGTGDPEQDKVWVEKHIPAIFKVLERDKAEAEEAKDPVRVGQIERAIAAINEGKLDHAGKLLAEAEQNALAEAAPALPRVANQKSQYLRFQATSAHNFHQFRPRYS